MNEQIENIKKLTDSDYLKLSSNDLKMIINVIQKEYDKEWADYRQFDTKSSIMVSIAFAILTLCFSTFNYSSLKIHFCESDVAVIILSIIYLILIFLYLYCCVQYFLILKLNKADAFNIHDLISTFVKNMNESPNKLNGDNENKSLVSLLKFYYYEIPVSSLTTSKDNKERNYFNKLYLKDAKDGIAHIGALSQIKAITNKKANIYKKHLIPFIVLTILLILFYVILQFILS